MPVRDVEDVDRIAAWLGHDTGVRRLGREVLALVDRDGRRLVTGSVVVEEAEGLHVAGCHAHLGEELGPVGSETADS